MLNITTGGKKVTTIAVKENPKKREKEQKEKTEEQESITEMREKTLKYARAEGVATAAKNGFVSNFIAPLAIHLGYSSLIIILLTAIPQLLGAISQLFVEKTAHFIRNRYKLLIITAKLEAYTWLPITMIAALSIKNPLLLIILVTLDAIFVNMQNPIWNALLGDVIPENRVAKYFGRRNIAVGISGLISLIIAGIILSKVSTISAPLAFTILFFLGFVFAKIAVNNQRKIKDPAPRSMKSEKYTFYQFLKSAKKNNFGTFTTFFSLYKLSVAIATPFFAIYMLRELNFSYTIFTMIITSAVISSMLFTKLWIKHTTQYGSKRTIQITSLLMPILPILWVLTQNWKILLITEFASGILWAGFNIATSTFIFEAVNPKQKIKFLAYNSTLAGIGTFIGTMLGLLITNINIKILGSVFLTIFLVSGILRFLIAIIFLNKIQEEKIVSINLNQTYKRFITIRPKEGIIFEIIGKTKTKQKTKPKKEIKKTEIKKIKNTPMDSPFKKKPKY